MSACEFLAQVHCHQRDMVVRVYVSSGFTSLGPSLTEEKLEQ